MAIAVNAACFIFMMHRSEMSSKLPGPVDLILYPGRVYADTNRWGHLVQATADAFLTRSDEPEEEQEGAISRGRRVIQSDFLSHVNHEGEVLAGSERWRKGGRSHWARGQLECVADRGLVR